MSCPSDSKVIAATGAVTSLPAVVTGVTVAAGADAAEIVIRDGGASGNIVERVKAAIGTTVNVQLHSGVRCLQSMHATISGTSPSIIVHYRLG